MTTRVTINAVDWPVHIIREEHVEPKHKDDVVKRVHLDVVSPFTTRDFYIHSGMKIISIEELPLHKEK